MKQYRYTGNHWLFLKYLRLNLGKRTFGHVRQARIKISLHIRAVWSEASLSTFWTVNDAKFFPVDKEDSNQTSRIRRLIWAIFRYVFSRWCSSGLDVSGKREFLTYNCLSNIWKKKNVASVYHINEYQKSQFWLIIKHCNWILNHLNEISKFEM